MISATDVERAVSRAIQPLVTRVNSVERLLDGQQSAGGARGAALTVTDKSRPTLTHSVSSFNLQKSSLNLKQNTNPDQVSSREREKEREKERLLFTRNGHRNSFRT
jgi:hypothetical protein